MKDHRSNVLNLSSWEKQAWIQIQAWTGIEPMTSAILVQRSKEKQAWIFSGLLFSTA